jgi:hypothetical protein
MGTRESHHGKGNQEVSHSRKSAAQRAKSLERLKAFRERAAAPVAPSTPQHSAAFDAAYSGHPITPEAAVWDDRGYCRWLLPTNSMGSRLSHSRNHANPST